MGDTVIKLSDSRILWLCWAVAACVGYVAACLVGVLIYVAIEGVVTKAGVGELPPLALLVFQMTLLTALPGFVFLRLLLGFLRRSDLPTFAVAGLLNAIIATVLFFEQDAIRVVPSVIHVLIGFFSGLKLQLLAIGLVVGATYWAVERLVLWIMEQRKLKAQNK